MLRLDNRENARIVEMCYKNHTTLINPIIDWTTDEVWEFLKEYNIPYCSLYDEGFKRLGCIGCPMGSTAHRLKEFERWPKYYNLYMVEFEKMIAKRGGWQTVPNSRRNDDMVAEQGESDGRKSRPDFTDPEAIMKWWIEEL